MFSSITLIMGLKTYQWKWFVFSGVLVGALALTKAVFLYVGIGLILVLLAQYSIRNLGDLKSKQAFFRISALGIVFFVSIIPWIIRNYIKLDTLEFTERGGQVLLTRAYKNEMDILGGIYYYSPSLIKVRIGPLLNYSSGDDEVGGPLQRLNRSNSSSFAEADDEAVQAGRPEDVISYYEKAKAERVRLVSYYSAQGVDDPDTLAEKAMQDEAIELIGKNPFKHLVMSFVFMWRGMWCMSLYPDSLWGPRIILVINAFAYLAIWIMAIIGLWKRHPEMIGIAVLPVGAMSFYALTSHYISRYSVPMIPNMIVALVVGSTWIVEWALSPNRRWFRRANKQNT